jgi:methylase of polypeptide subunit release factors
MTENIIYLDWTDTTGTHTARWRSERFAPPPATLIAADDRLTADAAYRLALSGTALVWRGDFQNARQLLQALARRIDRKPARQRQVSLTEAFHQQRQKQMHRSTLLSMVLIPLEGDYQILLRRAPDVRMACEEAWGPCDGSATLVSLRELQGIIGAHEWRKKGVDVPALGGRIHPYYGVFSPIRGEYLDLVASAPLDQLPAPQMAFDIGTGTGILAALLAKRGIARVIATDNNPRALACARDNLNRLQFGEQVEAIEADLYPEGQSPLIVCNPPWLPGKPSAALEHAIYDPDSRMLRGFLKGLAAHLVPGGEGWLILSDLAERLGLRRPSDLSDWIAQAGLKVVERMETRPRHAKASDRDDPLHAARAAEITSLWRLAAL